MNIEGCDLVPLTCLAIRLSQTLSLKNCQKFQNKFPLFSSPGQLDRNHISHQQQHPCELSTRRHSRRKSPPKPAPREFRLQIAGLAETTTGRLTVSGEQQTRCIVLPKNEGTKPNKGQRIKLDGCGSSKLYSWQGHFLSSPVYFPTSIQCGLVLSEIRECPGPNPDSATNTIIIV